MSRPAQARPTAAPDRAPAPRGVAAGAARTLRGALVPSMLAGALALGAPALGASPFGPLTAQSLRGEPLRAVVELPGADAPSVRLAVAAGYARFGLVRDPALDRLTLRAVIEPDGKRFLRIETDTPVDTAELVLLLETPDGLRRAYRLRLDSPEPADRVNVRGVEPIARLGGPAPAPAAAAPAATTVRRVPPPPVIRAGPRGRARTRRSVPSGPRRRLRRRRPRTPPLPTATPRLRCRSPRRAGRMRSRSSREARSTRWHRGCARLGRRSSSRRSRSGGRTRAASPGG
ncbi:MAG: hypothetical protein O9972_53460, partial [Burkholderiales bacterium]|nr:hypothetical protein [Burkholderiales bacterium]